METVTNKNKTDKKGSKQDLLKHLSKTREDFFKLEKEVSKNFASYSLNEIWEIKETLSCIDSKMKKIVKLLKVKHKVYIDLENRNNI